MALSTLPTGFAATVGSLHRVAEQIVSPARERSDGSISLAATPGGFGTPPFEHEGVRHQVRVEGTELVDGDRRAPLVSLESARAAVVPELVPAPLDDAPLEIDSDAAGTLGEAYAFGARTLQRLIDEAAWEDAPSPVKLWPEHFDIAIELGDESAGLRANYGLSPGDEQHDEPYLYVGPWTAEVSGELWNARGFRGAELRYSELVAEADPESAAHEFFTSRKRSLA